MTLSEVINMTCENIVLTLLQGEVNFEAIYIFHISCQLLSGIKKKKSLVVFLCILLIISISHIFSSLEIEGCFRGAGKILK